MALSTLIPPGGVTAELAATSRKQALVGLAELAERALGVAARPVLDAVIEREKLGSTGVGDGVAIPHAKIPGLARMCALVVLLDPAMPFDAVDDAPVDIVFALLSPVDSGAEHLKTLARVSRYLRDDNNVARLRGANSAEALFALLASGGARDAA